MTTLDFGRQLRFFRQKCSDTNTGKRLSQQKLGDFLQAEMGVRYSGAAISDWERGRSKISASDRVVLISLIKILKSCGGIKSIDEANLLLEAGNYRALNNNEGEDIFPKESGEADEYPAAIFPSEGSRSPEGPPLLEAVFFSSPELKKLLSEASEGPRPAWPRIMAGLIRNVTNQWNARRVLKVFIWCWIWLLTFALIAPSLQWPLPREENDLYIMVLYAGGTLILPLFIGAMVNTKNQAFWREQAISNTLTIRFYVHQGAYIGFHIGYFIIFPLTLIQGQLHISSEPWIEFIKMSVPLTLGYIGAQLIPYNLWRAYERLDLRDGSIFFVFALLGPLWACFFWVFYRTISSPLIGAIFTLLSATIFVLTQALKTKAETTLE